jgi:hypothetical protein
VIRVWIEGRVWQYEDFGAGSQQQFAQVGQQIVPGRRTVYVPGRAKGLRWRNNRVSFRSASREPTGWAGEACMAANCRQK